MTLSSELTHFPVWPLPETAMGLLCNCLEGALPHTPEYTLRDTIVPLGRSYCSPPRKIYLTRPPAMPSWRPSRTKTKTVPWLSSAVAHAVFGAFYSVFANRRQPNLHIIYWYIQAIYEGGGGPQLRSQPISFGRRPLRFYSTLSN